MLRLIVQNDQGRKAELPLESPEVTIGRGDDNTIQLDDRNVSRRHARLRQLENSYVLEDLGSSNGIWINGRRLVGNIFVKGGDSFRLGDYQLVVAEDSARGELSPMAIGSPETGPEIKAEDVELAELVDEPAPRWLDLKTSPARLILTNTAENGREFPLGRPVMRVGSAAGNEIRIADPSISSRHARLEQQENGDWQIDELAPAGLRINGDRRPRAKLRSGDEILLGDVSFTFIGPEQLGPLSKLGEAMSRPGQRLRAILILALVASVAGIGGGILVLFWLKSQAVNEVALSEPDRATAEPRPPRAGIDEPVRPSVKNDGRGAEESTAKTGGAAALPAAVPAQRFEPKLYAARAAMARKDFRRVVDLLAPLHNADGSRPPDAEELMQQANTELRAKKSLSMAQKNLVVGKLDDAGRYLDEASDTKAYAREYRQLKTRAETLTASRQTKRLPAKDSEGRLPARAVLAKLDERAAADEETLFKVTETPKSPETTSAPAAIVVPPPSAPPASAVNTPPVERPAIAALEPQGSPRVQRAVEPRTIDAGAWVVISHPGGKSSFSRSELQQIFGGDSVPTDGGRIMQLVLGPLGNPARRNFMSRAIGRNEAEFKAAWTRLVFRGGGVRPPLEMSDDEGVVAAVASRPGAIGVVREGTDLRGVVRVTVR